MKESVYHFAEMYAIQAINLSQLAEEVERITPFAQHGHAMREALDYAKYYGACYDAAMMVGCEVVIETPFETFKAFVTKDDGDYIVVDHDGETEKYHSSYAKYVTDQCDK